MGRGVRFLSIDTGNLSGVAAFDTEWIADGTWCQPWSDELEPHALEDFIAAQVGWADEVILEQLVITTATGKKTRDIQLAIELAGVVKYWCRVTGTKLEEQLPVEAMRFATNDVLKRVGWHVKSSKDHQNDARRHLLTRIAELRLIDLVTLLPAE